MKKVDACVIFGDGGSPPMIKVIRALFHVGPLMFAYGFIWPLTIQIVKGLGMSLPFGLTPLWAGFIIAALWGSYAQIKGSWI